MKTIPKISNKKKRHTTIAFQTTLNNKIIIPYNKNIFYNKYLYKG